MSSNKTSLTYKDSGVDIDAGNALVEAIKQDVKKTQIPGVLGNIGGFGGLFEIPKHYKEPVLVSGTDGVGTKLRLALDFDCHESVGQDLVAMCVNDLVVCGAKPMFFLDYFATGSLNVDLASTVIRGIAKGCQISGCALIGGETAEMPGMYNNADYDLAGFCVGVVEKSEIIDGLAVCSGDSIIGIKSSGPHSNGFSLIRKIIERTKKDPRDLSINGTNILESVMSPTKIYVDSILKLLEQKKPINAIAHITGGGLTENIPRVLPDKMKAMINLDEIELPQLFKWFQEEGNLNKSELLKTFNCGIGMILVVPSSEVRSVTEILKLQGEETMLLGSIVESQNDKEKISFRGNFQ